MFIYSNGDVNDIDSSQTCWIRNLKACQIIWARWVFLYLCCLRTVNVIHTTVIYKFNSNQFGEC